MLIDLDTTPDLALAADVVIVGAGAVGLTMAVTLSRAGQNVIVLEAGGAAISATSQNYFTLAQNGSRPLKGLHLGRFRALGGTTQLWGGQLAELDESLFEERSWLGDKGWPFPKSELAPFYHQAYALLGLVNRLDRDSIWRQIKTAPLPASDVFEDFFSTWLPEPNFARLFQREITNDHNLRIVINAPVVAIDAATGLEVKGVSIRGKDNRLRSCRGKHVILANGTIEMARLLKLPLANGQPAVWSLNPWLGKGFMDHLDCQVGRVVPIDKSRFHDLFDNVFLHGIKYMPKLRLSSSVQRGQRLNDACTYFLFDSAFGDHLARVKILARALLHKNGLDKASLKPRELLSTTRMIFPMIFRYLRYRRMYNPADLGIHARVTCEQRCVKTSALTLLDQTDALGMPILKLDWHVDGDEFETIATVAKHLKDTFETARLAEIAIDPGLLARDQRFVDNAEDSNHHMGMVRLGQTGADGVVDRNLRIFGTENLYAAGAAVFPSTGFANPTLTAIALGQRLADHIIASPQP